MTGSNFGIFTTRQSPGEAAGQTIPWRVFPHSLRHTTGYEMVNNGVDLRKIQAWLVHKQIASTVIYSELDERRFDGVTWRA